MKRLGTLFLVMALCLTMMAQGKLTPQARLHLMQKRAKMERQAAARIIDNNKVVMEPQHAMLVLTVNGDNLAGTVAQMKAVGAEVCSRLGRQIVIRIPTDSVGALQHIEGVSRIDKGHRGHWKSDVTRQVTGVAQLNGPALAEGATAYTGKGVTICLVDAGFDFQHPAFKDAEGRSRIKCVYLMGDNNGRKFTVNDPDLGEYTFPGSVYDTAELIATLTTDDNSMDHGTHTAGIAAGSLSPLGFGGMAPEADLVLIPLDGVEVEGYEDADLEDYMELGVAFAAAYAQQSEQPVVLSCSANAHDGPHDGTSSMNEAIEEASRHLIPVFAAGNEGGYPIHLYRKFTSSQKSVKTILIAMTDDETGEHSFMTMPYVVGYVRTGDEVSIQLTLVALNQFTGRINTLWTSEKCTATPSCDAQLILVDSDEDAELAKYFDGIVGIGAMQDERGRLSVMASAQGGVDNFYLWVLTVSGSEGTEVDLWDHYAGFGGVKTIGLPGYVDGDSDMSGGDWTSTPRVISVGAYCANTQLRDYDGSVTDTSKSEDEDDEVDKLNDIAYFSSYGTAFNGISQPVVCAPGVNVVSSVNHYAYSDVTFADGMQWEGYPYCAETGTSMACPAVAGIVALWLQAKPDMTFDDVMGVLSQSSVNDEFTTSSPIRWGYGKVSALNGINYITNSSEIYTLYDAGTTTSDVYYDLQGRRLSSLPSQRGIYVKNGKKIVIK